MHSIDRLNPDTLKAFPGVSQVVRAGDFVFVGGQVPIDPETGAVVGAGDVAQQAERVYLNLRLACFAAGGDLRDVIKTTTYLVRRDDFAAVSIVRVKLLEQHAPANATLVVAGLADDSMLVEVDAIAYIPAAAGSALPK